MEIVWKDLDFCAGKYSVSYCGKVRSNFTVSKLGKIRGLSTILKTTINNRGYEKVRLKWNDERGNAFNKTMAVHRLVAMAFIPNPENKPQVNHKDLNQLNNNADNLEWATAKENTNHAWDNGACKSKWVLSEETIKYIIDNYVRLGNRLLAEELKLPNAIVLKYAKKYGADIAGSLFKKVIDLSTGKIYNSTKEVSELSGHSIKNLRRWMSNERPNKTSFRYIDNKGNITEAKIFDIKPRYTAPLIKKPIAVFDLDWNEIKQFDYIADAITFTGVDRQSINDFLKGKKSRCSSFKFKMISEDGSFIEPIPFISKRPPKIIKPKGQISMPKKVAKYSLSNEFIEEYSSIGVAAKKMGTAKKQFKNQITRSKTGYHKGYFFKIVD